MFRICRYLIQFYLMTADQALDGCHMWVTFGRDNSTVTVWDQELYSANQGNFWTKELAYFQATSAMGLPGVTTLTFKADCPDKGIGGEWGVDDIEVFETT
jgi:hypothetical protein